MQAASELVKASVSAPGNIFLAGEHACIYGCDALVAAPGLRTTFTVEPSEEPEISVYSRPMELESSVPAGSLLNLGGVALPLVPTFLLVRRVCRDFNRNPKPMSITIESDIPVGGGLSSSTALLVSGYFALAEFLSAHPWNLEPAEVHRRILPLQSFIHGSASGTEIYSSHSGGFGLVRSGELASHWQLVEGERPACVVGDTGVDRRTRDVVASVARWKEEHPREFREVLSGIREVVGGMGKALGGRDWPLVGELMTENHNLLRRLGGGRGVSHERLDLLVEAALEAGAYGAKVSGAGRGGVMFALCPPGAAGDVGVALSKFGGACRTELGSAGVRRVDQA